ncbi:hypothetical protein FRB94_000327 [Tulasnella sp. JGI-2019a]|nr:hypothetical protein FRB94_000327 [Tulasnella sp. JGI-2019a]
MDAMFALTEIEGDTDDASPHVPTHVLVDTLAGPVPVLRQPFQDVKAYISRSYLPRFPDDLKRLLEEQQPRLLTEDINRGVAKAIRDVRSVGTSGSHRTSQPLGGRRTLAEIEQIDGECLGRAAYTWVNKDLPHFLGILDRAGQRPDLFLFDRDVPHPNGEDFAFTLPAVGFSTEDRFEEDMTRNNEYDGEEGGSLSAVECEVDGEDVPFPTPTNWSDVTQFLTRLTRNFRATLLVTAGTLVHISVPDRSLGWRWMTLEHARVLSKHRNGAPLSVARQPKKDIASMTAGWGVFVWARSPLQPCVEDESDKGCSSGSPTPLPRGVRVRGPGAQNDGRVVESREVRLTYVDLGMAVFIVPPTFSLTEVDFVDMCQSQEFSDGARGENDFTPGEAVWATIHAICEELGMSHFVVSTYTSIAFGAFASSFESAFISPPISTHQPDDWNPACGPIMAPFQPHRKLKGDLLVGQPRSNALQQLTYWMRTSMGDFHEGWTVPSKVDGSAGWSAAMTAENDDLGTVESSSTKEWLWPFTEAEPSNLVAHHDVQDFVEEIIFAERTPGIMTLGGQIRPTFIGRWQWNSSLMETRHAQMAQRLDMIALNGGNGADVVPIIVTTNESGLPLVRMWVEGEDRLVEMAGDAFSWVRPGGERKKSADGIEEVEEDVSQQEMVATDVNDTVAAEAGPSSTSSRNAAGILANLQMKVPNPVLLPSTTEGELPPIQNSVTGDLYRVFGSHVVQVGNGSTNHSVQSDQDNNVPPNPRIRTCLA